MCTWLQNEGEVAVFDATNTSRERRELIYDCCTKNYCFRLFFVESICDDPKVIQSNVKVCRSFFKTSKKHFNILFEIEISQEVKIRSPDYASFNDEEAALSDFLERIQFYENIYEQIDEVLDMNKSFIKIFNVGQRFLVNRVNGHIQSRVVYFLMNIHVLPRTIYLTRVGRTAFNICRYIRTIIIYFLFLM
jgi:hypothetical protein